MYVGAEGTVVEGAYVATATDGTGGSSYSFPTVSIGSADVTRRVVGVITWRASVTRTVSSVTFDGISATIHQNYSPSGNRGCAIVSAEVPDGGSNAAIVINMSGTTGINGSLSISTFRLLNCIADNGDTTSSSPTTVNAGYGDYIVSVAFFDGASGTVSWTAATEDTETTQDGSHKHCAASHSVTVPDATYDTEVSISGSGNLAMASQVFTAA